MGQSRLKIVSIVQNARRRAAARCLMLAASVIAVVGPAAPTLADDRPMETLSLNFLFPMAGGTATRASAMVALAQNRSTIDVWEHAIAGSARDAAGRWVPVFWLCNNEVIDGPFLFFSDGRRGQASDLAVDPNNPNVVYIGGTVFDDASAAQTALWTVNLAALSTDDDGHVVGGVKFQPFPGQFSGGVRVAVGDINGDGVADIAVGGTTTALLVPAVQKVRVAIHLSGTPGFTNVELPVANPNGNSGLNALTIQLENVLISGYSFNQNGRQQATLWRLRAQDIEVENDETHWNAEHSFLPGGSPSQARTETVGANETLTVGGSRTDATGKTMPAIWLANRSSAGWQGRNLPLIDGFNGGRANGIIAILIGLLVPGEVSSPRGQSAAIWHVDAEGRAIAIDLNSVTPNLEAGVHLNSVSCLLPYVEQDNIYKVMGSATGPRGQQLGYVGSIIGSPEYFNR